MNESEDFIRCVEPGIGKCIAKKVLYGPADHNDPDSKDNEHYEVVNVACIFEVPQGTPDGTVFTPVEGNPQNIQIGDLFSASKYTQIEKTVAGVNFYVVRLDQIDYIIRKRNVKEDLLK